METNPETIIANILDDMAEIGDWTSIADALAANGRNPHFARREEVLTILTALKQSPEIAVGRLAGDFRDLPDPQPVGAMMETLMRPTGKWPQKEKGSKEATP